MQVKHKGALREFTNNNPTKRKNLLNESQTVIHIESTKAPLKNHIINLLLSNKQLTPTEEAILSMISLVFSVCPKNISKYDIIRVKSDSVRKLISHQRNE